ncbi:SulP family inorganic anion transporter [Aquihabitans sp. McL0605]|uniref:SulP family inorganic anion transporter n=1 Tax=Aquihabitans sp. McL0605 TaxID=3415671 RepID=UPI003CF89D50
MTAPSPSAAGPAAGAPSALQRFVPIVGWLPRYDKRWFSKDAIAGATIWGLLIPEMIAYAGLAGLPPQAGLYTLIASLVLYAVFGTSRHLVVAGTSAAAVLVFSTITDLKPADPTTYMALAAGLIVLTGILFVVAGLCKLGFITAFLSKPVMEGFVFGLAIFITISQLPKLFGLDKGDGNSIEQLGHLVRNLGDTSLTTFAVGGLALAALFLLERFLPKLPGGLILLVVAIGVSAALDLAAHGVATVGSIPTGLPTPNVPDVALHDLWVLLPSAAGLMLVIFSEALGAGQNFADKYDYRLDPDQEMIALGAANIGSGLLGGLACGGSLSQSAVNDGAGARSEMSTIVAAVLALVTVIALTPLFTDLPEAVLGALIVHAVSHLMKVPEMRRFYRLAPREFWLGMITLGAVLVLDVLPALIIGVVVSIILLVYRASRPQLSVLGQPPQAPGVFLDAVRHPEAVPTPGVLVLRPDAPLFYANAQAIQDDIVAQVDRAAAEPSVVIIDLDSNDELDITSTAALDKLAESLAKRGIVLALAHLHGPAASIARADGLTDRIGETRIFANLALAVAWAQEQAGGSRA